MSDKLIVEFYSPENLTVPVACVLTKHGGDNPSSAATTLADFFDSLAALAQPRFNDAGILAARFVVWQAIQETGQGSVDFFGVSLVPFLSDCSYQTVRVYADEPRPYVHCVKDEWTTSQELAEACIILRQAEVGPLGDVLAAIR